MTRGCKKQQESRKTAYHYIVLQAKGTWSPPIDSDERLADVLDIPIGELVSLKEGRSDPSQKLVAKFKELFGPWINDDDVIDSYFVSPFLTKT